MSADGDVAAICARAAELRRSAHYDRAEALLIDAARRVFAGWRPEGLDELAATLRDHELFGHARRVFALVPATDATRAFLLQQRALCTYKDPELPAGTRFDLAQALLETDGPVEQSRSAETLGLAGAIAKRRWELTGDRRQLENARWYYEKGYARVGDERQVYCGVNAAFVADQLAVVTAGGRGARGEADRLRTRADEIRRELVLVLHEPLDRWDRATLAEALFGLGRFPEAEAQLARVHAETNERWRLETTATQLAELARLRGHDGDEHALTALAALFGGEQAALRRTSIGKVGLALSGGGYRASLFHIGVLARLAETNVLRQVEVLSCVSGGSILGAFYGLKLRELLHERADDAIADQDYVDLVRALADEFLEAVQGDLRGRLLADARANWDMLSRRYSRAERVADLLEELLFARVPRARPGPWRMSDLLISPLGRTGFSPRHENWRRAAKVPALVINATALNTGHCWQFTPTWMGESPAVAGEQVEAAPRLRRMRYTDAPEPHRDPPLAQVVAASACVPGLLPPLRLAGLFPDVEVALVDGGVHDNQGIASLLEQDCNVILVSDASGQISDRDRPDRNVLGVTMRANAILMSRVRGAQLSDLRARVRAGTLRGLMVVHLKRGLPTHPRDWVGCPEPSPDGPVPAPRYAIAEDVQRALAELRTDLDAFTPTEAHCLMAAGYLMTARELDEGAPGLRAGETLLAPAEPWPFAAALWRVGRPGAETGLDLELGPGRARFMRARLRRRLGRAAAAPAPTPVRVRSGGALRAAGGRTLRMASAPVAVTGALAVRMAFRRGGGKRR